MSERSIYITEYDAKRLLDLIQDPSKLEHREPASLESLRDELSRAQIVAPEDVPPDVITMNSTIEYVDVDSREEETLTLVFPSDADTSQNRISVLAPIGTAMLGYRAGSTIAWNVPGGVRHLRIKHVVYQPEASGDYDL